MAERKFKPLSYRRTAIHSNCQIEEMHETGMDAECGVLGNSQWSGLGFRRASTVDAGTRGTARRQSKDTFGDRRSCSAFLVAAKGLGPRREAKRISSSSDVALFGR